MVLIFLFALLTRTEIYSSSQDTPESIINLADEWSSVSGSTQDLQDSTIVEVWSILSDNFVDKETLNPESISDAGLYALLAAIAKEESHNPSTLSYITIDAVSYTHLRAHET